MAQLTPPPSPRLLKFLHETIPQLEACQDLDPADVDWFRQFTRRLHLEAEPKAEETAGEAGPVA